MCTCDNNAKNKNKQRWLIIIIIIYEMNNGKIKKRLSMKIIWLILVIYV